MALVQYSILLQQSRYCNPDIAQMRRGSFLLFPFHSRLFVTHLVPVCPHYIHLHLHQSFPFLILPRPVRPVQDNRPPTVFLYPDFDATASFPQPNSFGLLSVNTIRMYKQPPTRRGEH